MCESLCALCGIFSYMAQCERVTWILKEKLKTVSQKKRNASILLDLFCFSSSSLSFMRPFVPGRALLFCSAELLSTLLWWMSDLMRDSITCVKLYMHTPPCWWYSPLWSVGILLPLFITVHASRGRKAWITGLPDHVLFGNTTIFFPTTITSATPSRYLKVCTSFCNPCLCSSCILMWKHCASQ